MGADDTTGGTACDTPCQNSEETVTEERKECSENNTPLTPGLIKTFLIISF